MPYPYVNPYLANPYVQQMAQVPQVPQQSAMLPQQQGPVRVSGRDEAMNRLLMMYPANMLVPGFTSEPLFDIDGTHFHALSIEADGSRNLETFAYQLETSQLPKPGDEYVTRAELEAMLSKMTGGDHGVPEPVQESAATA